MVHRSVYIAESRGFLKGLFVGGIGGFVVALILHTFKVLA